MLMQAKIPKAWFSDRRLRPGIARRNSSRTLAEVVALVRGLDFPKMCACNRPPYNAAFLTLFVAKIYTNNHARITAVLGLWKGK